MSPFGCGEAGSEAGSDRPLVVVNQLTLPGRPGVLASVEHRRNSTRLALPPHDPSTPATNGMIVLHEATHLADARSPGASDHPRVRKGCRERRAYTANMEVLVAADGETFLTYVMGTMPAGSGSLTPERAKTTPPPKGTLTRELWDEGETGRRALAATVLVASVVYRGERAGLPDDTIHQAIGAL